MKKLNRVYIEITNICNKSCSFCIQNSREPRMMSLDEFRTILNNIRGYTTNIYLHVLGEPLLHPHLKEFLDISEEYGMSVNITTNGTLLKKQSDILLQASSLRKISVSLHSFEDGNDTTYFQEVLDFVLKASTKGVYSELRLWNLGVITLDNSPIIEMICKQLCLEKEKITELLNKINEVGNTTLLPRLFLGKQERFTWPDKSLPIIEGPKFCHGMRSQIAILVDGSVVPCCLDSKGDILLGNIYQEQLSSILSSQKAKKIYEEFSNHKASEELCKRCQYATKFVKK